MDEQSMSLGVEQFKLEYDQRVPGYSGDLAEHWPHKQHVFETLGKAKAHLAGLHAYMEQQAEHYPGEWVRNISPIMRRDVTYSEWQEMRA
jgi:hypothetical protein